MPDLPEIVLPESCNYIAAFLTFSCQLRCTYCINHHGGDLVKGRWMSGQDWIRALCRIKARRDLPVTVQGGEPTVHKHFKEIINGIREDMPIDLLTNLEVDADWFMGSIPAGRLKRASPYASIRVSFHKGQSEFGVLTDKVLRLQGAGYHIGIWEVDHPDYHGEVIYRQQVAHSMGIDYRLKEFLGPHGGKVYGTIRYPDSVDSHVLRHCMCRTSELLIAPDGKVFRCHSDLYADRASVGHILDPHFTAGHLNKPLPCSVYGKCNSCDVKIKTNRFQQYGHSSVTITEVSESYAENDEFVTQVINTYGKQDTRTH